MKSLKFKVIKGLYGLNDEYKYNVQVHYNGKYTGNGRFCKNKKEVKKYIRQYKKQEVK